MPINEAEIVWDKPKEEEIVWDSSPELRDTNTDVIHSELLGIPASQAAESRNAIKQVLKDRYDSLALEREKTKQIETGVKNGNWGALIPYLGLSAFKGLTDIVFKPLGKITGLRSDKMIENAVEYWKSKSPDIKFVDVGVDRPEGKKIPSNFGGALKSWLTDWELQKRQGSVKEIAGATAEIGGLVSGPLRIASTASNLVVGATAKAARPFFQSIYRGMGTGALIGEGDAEKTLYNMALFGIFDGMTGFLGRISSLPKIITESEAYRKLTIKEKGLVIQSLDEAVQGAERQLELLKQRGATSEALQAFAEKTEGQILRAYENPEWRKQALKKRIKPEEPIEVEAEFKPREPELVKTTKRQPPSTELTAKATYPYKEPKPTPDKGLTGRIKAEEIKTLKQLAKQANIRAVEKVSGQVEKEIKKEDPFIKVLKAEETISKSDVRIAQRLKEEDIAIEYEERVLEEESKILAKMVKKTIRKDLKGVIRRESGQEKIKNIIEVDEGKALKEQIRLEAKAAREAFSAGKKESALKHKEKQRELTLRARERKQLKGRIKKAAEFIAKDVPKSVDFYYREAIENLTAGIDPSFRQKRTLKRRRGTKEFLERKSPEKVNIPIKILKMLDKKPLQDFTVDELEDIVEAKKKLEKLGKLKRKLKLKQKRAARQRVEADIIDTVLKGKKLEDKAMPVVESTTKQSKLQRSRRLLRAITLRPGRVADKLDRGQNYKGPAHKFFINDVNDITTARLRKQDERKEFINDAFKKNRLSIRDLYKTRTIEGIEYLVDEMLDIYAGSKNLRKKLAIIHGNDINEKLITKIINALSSNEKAFADAVLEDYERNYSRLRDSVIVSENRDMGYEENYSPIRRTEIDYATMTQEVIDEILHRNHLKKAFTQKGMTLSRVDIPEEYQKPIRLSLYASWLEQMPKQEQYIHFVDKVKDMHRVLEGDIGEALEQAGGALGREYLKAMRNYVDRVADPNIYKSYNGIENLSRTLRQNTAIYYLSGNFLTMAKQLPSVMFYLPESGPIAMSRAFAEFVADPVGTLRFVAENDPQVKHRSLERELEELKNLRGGNIEKIKNKIGKKGMVGIYLVDRIAISIGWKSVYNANVEKLGNEGAAKLARDVTLRTQPQAAAKDLPDIYATNEILNWFLQFTNQLNQIYNIGTHDIPNYIKNKKAGKALLATMAIALNALWIWSITNKRTPKKPEDVKDALSDQFINSIPVIGKTIAQQKRGWSGGGEIPPLKGIGQATRGIIKTDRDASQRAEDIAKGVGILTGVPGTAIERTYKFLETGEPIELIGGKPRGKKTGFLKK